MNHDRSFYYLFVRIPLFCFAKILTHLQVFIIKITLLLSREMLVFSRHFGACSLIVSDLFSTGLRKTSLQTKST